MFKLVGVQGVLFAIQDTEDNVIDVLPKGKICKCLNLGLEIGGITKVSDFEFDYTDEFFLTDESDSCEEDDFYEGYEEEDEDCDDEDDYDSYYDSYTEEDFDSEEQDDYDSYYEEEEEVSTVNRLYSFLNEEQIKLLKRYYLWFSQRIFDEGKQQNRTLQVTSSPRKLQKQKELNVIRNQGGMWAYAGFIDMGYRGADYCTLGHPLRYVHLAWDITVSDIETSFFGEEYNKDIESVINSSNCIKFGIDCISDFFEIDKEYTDKLKGAQREAIKDMDFMCQYYEDGIADKVISSFTVMDDIINHISKVDAKGILLKGKDYKCLVPKSLTSFYRQFRQLGMVVPKSLIQEIRDNLIGWGSHKFIGWRYPDYNVLCNVIRSVLGKSSDKFVDTIEGYSYGYSSVVTDYIVDFFQLKSCGFYEYDASTFKDEGGASKPVKTQLYALLRNVDKNFWSDKEYTFNYLSKLVELDTLLREIKGIISNFKILSESYNSVENRYYIDEDNKKLDSNSLKHYDKEYGTDIYMLITDLSDLTKTFSKVCKIDYNKCYSLDEFLPNLKGKVQKLTSEVDRYQTFALDKLQEKVDEENAKLEKEHQDKEKVDAPKMSDEEIRQYCIDNVDKVKGNSKLKFALAVLDTFKRTGKCSDKQMYYIGQIYSELTGVQLEDKRQASKVKLNDRKDIEDAIDKVLANPDLLENEDNKEKVHAILTSIKKYRTISEKQMKYAEIALELTRK